MFKGLKKVPIIMILVAAASLSFSVVASALIPYNVEVTLEGPYLVNVDGSETEVALGSSVQYFFFNYHTQKEDELLNGKAFFSSSNPSVGTIEQDGIFTAIGIGTTTITATYGNLTASVTVSVPALDDIHLLLNKEIMVGNTSYEIVDNTLGVGEHYPYRVVATSSAGSVQLTDTISVTSSNPSIIKVLNGELVGVAPGRATISVQSGHSNQETEFYVRVPVPSPTTDKNLLEQFDKGLQYVNNIRIVLGLMPLTTSKNLHLAAQAHADYMRVNGFNEEHFESEGKSNYFGKSVTSRFHYAGYDSFISNGWDGEVMTLGLSDPIRSLMSLIDAPLHRMPLLDPVFRDIGIAVNSTGQYKNTVADLGVLRIDEDDLQPIVHYPYKEQIDVPISWTNNEIPNPLARFPDAPKIVGYPITISGSSAKQKQLDVVSAMITDASGTAVDYYLTTGSGVILTPKKPLSPGTQYTVSFSGQYEDEPLYEQTWSFTTEMPPLSQDTIGGGPESSFNKENIGIMLNGQLVTLTPNAMIRNKQTFIPLRGVFEELGATVKWDSKTKSITVTKDSTIIKLTINSKTAYVNGNAITLSTAPFLNNNYTFVPLRFVSEALDAKVNWNAEKWIASISDR
ncbi:stalk domain-containing protein [Paenibacillus sp. CAU 1782]